MNIQAPSQDLSGTKTLKISIPKKLHLHLHSRKLLTGETISETVEDALLAYLGEEPEPVEALEQMAGA